MDKEVLEALRSCGDEGISGQAISRRLGVSRTAIWKSVQALRAAGFRIDSRPGKGYMLQAGPERLVGLDIETGLGTLVVGSSVRSFDSVPSTIDVASALAQEGAHDGTVVVAESQTGGRGRLGRTWSSPADVGIWTSIILRPAIPPRDAPKLTLLVAVSVATVLNERYGIAGRIKWPNDVVVQNRKICGALTELAAEQDAVKYIIASFGLNVNHTRTTFPSEVRSIATSMRIEAGRTFHRPDVFRAILCMLDEQYQEFREHGSAAIVSRWRELSCTLGKHVKVQLRDSVVEGTARDLDEDGSLLVEVSEGDVRSIAYGDVTILR
jgi:BirA family biotin operon repressor/biotin-[acetyl-CoA-carboxylase] ligase